MEPFRDETDLIAELRALRPTPAPAFAAELDERAAAGFPRPAPLGVSPLGDLVGRLRALSPRHLLFSTGATALAAVAVIAVVVASNEPRTSLNVDLQPASHSKSDWAKESSGLIPFSKRFTPFSEGAPAPSAKPKAGGSLNGGFAGGLMGYSNAAEPQAVIPDQLSQLGPFAAGAAHRDIERSAEIVLGADPADVGDDSTKVFDAVHAAGGIVLRSSTSEGRAGQAGASFDLLIPSARLSDALAAFSDIDTVRSRHEATADITAPTVTAAERLRDSRARIDGLLAQLSAAETESERELVESELGAERRHAVVLSARLAKLHRRTSFSRVSLRIETGASASPADEGSWGIGDALHDAGHILAVAAAVALVALAVLGPIALIALLAWLVHRAWLRRTRERALG